MVVVVVEFAGVAGGGGFCFSLVDALVDCVVVDEEEDEVVLDLFLFRLARVFFCSSALTQLVTSNSFDTSSASSLLEKDNVTSLSNKFGNLVHHIVRALTFLGYFFSLGTRYLNDHETDLFQLENEYASLLS